MKQNVPFAPQRYFDLSGLPLDGGYLWVYQKGTSTPATAAIWFDADGLVAGSNPVQLDGAGQPQPTGAFYLDPGAYTLVLFGADDVQIGPPVDVVIFGATFGGGSETVSQGVAIICKTYDDVRSLSQAWDVVYACGRSADGDGGEGWFQHYPLETGDDDDGICLVAGARRYVRIFDAEIRPEWFGLVYGGTVDQTVFFGKCLTASLRWKTPIAIAGDVYLTQNATILDGEALNVHRGGRFIASTGSAVVMTFKSGSRLEAKGETFGVGISPKFEANVVDVVYLSWMGGAVGDDKIAKLAGCAVSGAFLTAIIDATINVSASFTFPANVPVDVVGGRLNVVAAINVAIPVFIYSGTAPWLVYGALAYVGTINLGNRISCLEWFGAVGDGTTDDSTPWKAGVNQGRVHLYGKYKVTQAVTTGATLELSGDIVNATGYHPASAAASSMPLSSVIFSGSSTRITIPANGILGAAGIGIAFDDATGKISESLSTSAILLENCVVYSAAAVLIFDVSVRNFDACSLTSKTIIGALTAGYVSCSFGVGSYGVSSEISIDKVAYLNYLTPSTEGAVPPLVCRGSDKSVQLGSHGVIPDNALLIDAMSIGSGTIETNNYRYIAPTDPATIYFTSTSNIIVDLPLSTEMDSSPGAPTVRFIVLCRVGVGTDNTLTISNAALSCWYPDFDYNVRLPSATSKRMVMMLVYVNGRWAVVG